MIMIITEASTKIKITVMQPNVAIMILINQLLELFFIFT